MLQINLQPDEGIVLQRDNVAHSPARSYLGSLILTNKNIYYVKHGYTSNKIKDLVKIPLSQIKIIDQNAQVIMSGSLTSPRLQIFLKSGQEEFLFGNSLQPKKEMENWINVISQQVTGTVPNSPIDANCESFVGAKQLTESFKDVFSTIKATVGMDAAAHTSPEANSITCKCIGCMATISGTIGQRVRCKYCDTDQVLQ